MHAAYAKEGIATGGNGSFRATFPDAPPAPPHDAVSPPTGGYGEARRPNLPAIVGILALHAVALVGLVKADVISIHKKAPPPLVVVDLAVEPPAPPPPPAAPEPQVRPVTQVTPVAVAPPPIVAVPVAAPPIAVMAEAPPPQAVVIAPAAKPSASSGPVAVDLSSNLIYTKAPRIPTESRRKRESGTVTLWVVVGTDGDVAKISVSQSSGFPALDEAALDAVRKWRWKPTVQGGEAVMVSGKIPITFNVTG